MTFSTVNALANHLAAIDADWRKLKGYKTESIHCRDYWRNMAARLLSDSVKALSEKPQPQQP